jgi:glutaredoxin
MLRRRKIAYEARDVISNRKYYEEMVSRTGQTCAPCVEINGEMLADVGAEEVEAWLRKRKFV